MNLFAYIFIGVALLPLYIQPLRFEAYETHHAGLLLLLLIAAAPTLYQQRGRGWRSPLGLALLVWCVVLAASTLFALSPARAFTGDLPRRMGWLTQVAIVAAAGLGASSSLTALWRWFWLGGIVVAVHVLLQAAGWIPIVSDIPRPEGLLGAAPFTGGWLSLALLWTIFGWITERDLPRRWLYVGGMGLLLLALAVTGARGASLGLMAGLLTAGFTWAAVQKRRATVLGLLLLPILGGLLVLGLGRINWANTPFSGLSILSRLYSDPTQIDFTRLQREAYWQTATTLVRTWPTLTNTWGQADRWTGLRPLLGYGLDSFESPYRLSIAPDSLASLAGRPTDRAHNDWYDTLLLTGWAGITARLSLWLAIIGMALRGLGLWHWRAVLSIGIGAAMGFIFGQNNPWLPIMLTGGGIAGLWFWLSGRAWHGTRRMFDPQAALALAVLVAYGVDLQFSFTTAATAWPAWLAFGLLLAPVEVAALPFERHALPLWAGLAGAVLLRALILSSSALSTQVTLLAVIIVAARIVQRLSWRECSFIVGLWLVGIGGALLETTYAASWDVGVVLIGLLWLGGVAWRKWTALSLLAAACIWWGTDIAADIALKRSLQAGTTQAALTDLQSAAGLRPWDDRITGAAGAVAFDLGQVQNSAELLTVAQQHLLLAAELHPFEYSYAWRLALVEASLAQTDTLNRAAHLTAADGYFAAATALWPAEPDIWAGWARFSLSLKGDETAATQQAQTALKLAPDNAAAQAVLDVIGR